VTDQDRRLTDAQTAELREHFERAMRAPCRYRLLTPLPRRVRARLWVTRRVDGIGIWLVGHRRFAAAQAWWQVCGTWGRR
jgi:hypothetical protein